MNSFNSLNVRINISVIIPSTTISIIPLDLGTYHVNKSYKSDSSASAFAVFFLRKFDFILSMIAIESFKYCIQFSYYEKHIFYTHHCKMHFTIKTQHP